MAISISTSELCACKHQISQNLTELQMKIYQVKESGQQPEN